MRKEERLEKLIRGVWSSLESHLVYTHRHSVEGRKFHKKCIKEYAVMIEQLSKLL